MKQTLIFCLLFSVCMCISNESDQTGYTVKKITQKKQLEQLNQLRNATIDTNKDLCKFGQLTKQNRAHTFFSIARSGIRNTSLWKEKLALHSVNPETSHFDIQDNILHLAIAYHNKEIITYLLKNNLFDANNSRAGLCLATPLHTVVQYISFFDDQEMKKNYLDTLTLLLELGAHPGKKNFKDETAVEYAKRKGVLEIICQHLEKTKTNAVGPSHKKK